MEDIEMEEAAFGIDETNDDLCSSILSRFANSTDETRHHLCAVVGAMSQELKDNNQPASPFAYFCAARVSLDKFTSEPNPPSHVIDALLTILSLALPRVPLALLKKQNLQGEPPSELLWRVLRSPSASESALLSGLKCLSRLLIAREIVDWSDVSPLFNVLLGFLTDSRPKLHECFGSALVAMGPETLLSLIPLNLEANCWRTFKLFYRRNSDYD